LLHAANLKEELDAAELVARATGSELLDAGQSLSA
jgi:hypothetical protein